MPGNYDYDLQQIEAERNADIAKLDTQFNQAIQETEQTYDRVSSQYTIDANDGKTTAVEQLMETQQQMADQAVKEIEQQREKSEKDYIKEQAGAYADWKKQSNQYGVNAEKMAMNGLTGSGYSESSQVQMYTAYQARVTSAREVFKQAELDFTNAIANARLQNSAALAQIALDAFERQSEIILAGLSAKQGLLRDWTSQKLAVQSHYDNRYQMVLDQIYREEQMQLEREQMAQEQARWQAQLAQDQAQFEAGLAADREKLDWQKELAQLERDDAARKEAKADKEDEYNRLAELIATTGHPATDAELEAAGMSRERANSYLQYYNEKKKATGGSTGGSGNTDGAKIMDNTGNNSDNIAQQPSGVTVPTAKTYKEATVILSNMGVDSSNLMTSLEWARHKNAGNSNDPAVTDNATYQDYLDDYLYGATISVWPNVWTYEDPPKKSTAYSTGGANMPASKWEKHGLTY